MKKTIIFGAMLPLIAMVSCNKEEKIIETNSRGVPMSIACIIMGDTYDIDTLYHSPETTVIHIDNPDYTQNIIYMGEEIIANGPMLRVDSLSPSVYQIQDLIRDACVNFADVMSIEKFKQKFPQYTDYHTVVVNDTTTLGQKAEFAYAVSRPTDKVKDSNKILRWLENCIDDTLAFNSNVKAFGEQMEKAFFSEWGNDESEYPYVSSRSMLVYQITDNYVTYNDYFYGYMGGAHGITCNRYVSFLKDSGQGVTTDYLFKTEELDNVRELIYEAIAADEDFMSDHRITSLSQARSYIQRNLNGESLPIPDPGLLPEGVVFSYQPYEIAPYSDGIFELVIPYSKIAKYFAVNPLAHKK